MVFEITLLLDIAILLFFAKIFGEITERLKLSSLVGEIFAGIFVGPIMGFIHPNDFLGQISFLGIIFLLFLIGLSTKFDDVKKNIYVGSALAIAGTSLSTIGGFLVGYLWFNSPVIGLVLGFSILSTSTAMTIRALIEVGHFRTNVYDMALAIDIADEVIAILALSFLTSWISVGGVSIWNLVVLFLSVVGFFLIILTAGANAVGKFLSIVQKAKDEHMLVAIPLVIVFGVAFLSEQVGVAAVTGAFLAGMAMRKSQFTDSHIIPSIKTIGYGIFIPLFFAYSALVFEISAIFTSFTLIILLVVVGLLAKLIGTGLMARFFGFDRSEQLIMGTSMFPRGEYSIIISQVALASAIITREIYTVVIAFVIISIVLTPPVLRLLVGRSAPQKRFKIGKIPKMTKKKDDIFEGITKFS